MGLWVLTVAFGGFHPLGVRSQSEVNVPFVRTDEYFMHDSSGQGIERSVTRSVPPHITVGSNDAVDTVLAHHRSNRVVFKAVVT